MLVPVACLVAGFGFATSASASGGRELRSPQTVSLAGLVRAAEQKVAADSAVVGDLNGRLAAARQRVAGQDAAVAAAQQLVTPLRDPAGLVPVTGPGLSVVLDDAHGPVDPNLTPEEENQLVVHQSDIQAVVNSLWAGGAEALAVAGQRLIPTSAIRCVGNTLLLNGRVFSPPYRVAAIGPAAGMEAALDRSPGVALYRQAAQYYGLAYSVGQQDALSLPAYDGSISLAYAKAGPQ